MDEDDIKKQATYLKNYYQIFFPYKEIFQWLTYGDESQFSYREFSYTGLDNVFHRYKSFDGPGSMQEIFSLDVPIKVDVSALYNVRPSPQTKNELCPVQKEVVFDIDLTDYDEVRTCCSGIQICIKCWVFIIIACKVLNATFKEDWGFKHVLWIFSGRRGIHAWVCDKKFLQLDNTQREGIIEIINLIKGNIFGGSRVRFHKLHYTVKRALKIIEPYFIPNIIIGQDILGSEESVNKFLRTLPNKDIKEQVEELFELEENSHDRWNAFINYFESELKFENKAWLQHRFFIEETIIRYCYPRLDISVTSGMNHLLKLPFSVHPKTGKIAVAFDVEKISSFNFDESPTIKSLWDEKIAYDADVITQNTSFNIADIIMEYEKTSLKESIDVFKNFIEGFEDDCTNVHGTEKTMFKINNVLSLLQI